MTKKNILKISLISLVILFAILTASIKTFTIFFDKAVRSDDIKVSIESEDILNKKVNLKIKLVDSSKYIKEIYSSRGSDCVIINIYQTSIPLKTYQNYKKDEIILTLDLNKFETNSICLFEDGNYLVKLPK